MSTIFPYEFKRRFSASLYKNLKLPLGEMSFAKDFAHTNNRGDLYPILDSHGDLAEEILGGIYRFSGKNARITRLLGGFFPYASYEFIAEALDGEAGFVFRGEGAEASVILSVCDGAATVRFTENGANEICFDLKDYTVGDAFIVSARAGNFDVFIRQCGGYAVHATSFAASSFNDSVDYEFFSEAIAAITLSGEVLLSDVSFYLDSGISQADIRPIRYENGDIMEEGGKIFLSLSVRMWHNKYQGIFSWVPGTMNFELVGALFFDSGDGRWECDVASSIIYNRPTKEFYVWVCAFSHGHILGHGKTKGDIRYGVNVLDITLMKPMTESDAITDFLGKTHDEDPDFMFDEESKKWYMSICRIGEDGKNYRYHFFESNDPFEGYKCIGYANDGCETGGSIVKTDDGLLFVCGSDFNKRSVYHVYKFGDFSKHDYLTYDYDDGGFRGWGTIVPFMRGSRRVYYQITFDRHNGSDYNWSYGNIYCFEAKKIK